MMEQEILSFIKLVRDAVPDAVKVFTEGNCGSFARMLLYAFPDGKILHHYPRHFVFEHGPNIYDITGVVNGQYEYLALTPIKELGDINTIIHELTPRYK